MKQVILLEEHEVKRLEKGKQMEILTPSGIIRVGFDLKSKKEIEPNGHNGKGRPASKCKPCGKTFKNAHGLAVHNSMFKMNGRTHGE